MRLSFFLIICGFCVLGLALLASNDPQRTANDAEKNSIKQTNITGFTVIGIEARTDNAKESTPNGIIPKQWQRFFNEGIPSKIPDATGPVFYAVYSDYASDHNGEYAYLVGQGSGMALLLLAAWWRGEFSRVNMRCLRPRWAHSRKLFPTPGNKSLSLRRKAN